MHLTLGYPHLVHLWDPHLIDSLGHVWKQGSKVMLFIRLPELGLRVGKETSFTCLGRTIALCSLL